MSSTILDTETSNTETSGTDTSEKSISALLDREERYRVSVEEYISFRKRGFLVVRGLVSQDDIAELRRHTEDLMQGKLPEQTASERDASPNGTITGLEAPPEHLSPDEKAQYFLRIHMLHRRLELHERYMLHPRVLSVLEALIGPDVLALQTMLFLKPPGKPGQGWHQDTYYISTHPDSLCGAWIAIDDCDEMNGAMWMADGSGTEPIYPARGHQGHGDYLLGNINGVSGVSDTNDEANDLARVADKYPQVLVSAKAGDVVFFNGHVLHRSKANFSTNRYRRAFVSHYCNARSFTQWGANHDKSDVHAAYDIDPVSGMTNSSHILARGDTHLPFALPRFGTPCAALLSPDERRTQSGYASAAMADMESGMMDSMPADPDMRDEHDASGSIGY